MAIVDQLYVIISSNVLLVRRYAKSQDAASHKAARGIFKQRNATAAAAITERDVEGGMILQGIRKVRIRHSVHFDAKYKGSRSARRNRASSEVECQQSRQAG